MLMKLSNDFRSQKWVRDTRNGDQPLFLLRPRGQPRISCYPELSGRARSKRSRQPECHGFTLSSSYPHPFDQLWIYFLICRLALQAICRHCSPGSRRRKIKYFTVGGFAIKLRAHEGGWGHSNPSPRHLKYFRTGAVNPVKSSQYPHLSAQLFAPNIYWNICEVPRAVKLWFQCS